MTYKNIIKMTSKGELSLIKSKTGYDVLLKQNLLDHYTINILSVTKNQLDIAIEYYNSKVKSMNYKNIPSNEL
jgi:hypothetical protein